MKNNPKKWDFVKPKDFRDQVINLPKFIRPKLTEIMTLLSESNNPLDLGKKKLTKYGIFYTIKLNDSYRLAYDLDPKDRKIRIYRVGDHDFVYGKK